MSTKTKNHVFLKVKRVLSKSRQKKIDTWRSRVDLGFPAIETWVNAPAEFDEHTLHINGHPVMEDWEINYMDELARIATTRPGKILEVGYGMGLSAAAIQKHKPRLHVIIECNDGVIRKAKSDIKELIDSDAVQLLKGFWQDVTPTLPDESFDGILFDTYPIKEEEIHSNHFWFFEEAHRLLKPGGILTYYSDEATNLSPAHRQKLAEAGFNPDNLQFTICQVDPPPDCEYWQDNTILAPIITK